MVVMGITWIVSSGMRTQNARWPAHEFRNTIAEEAALAVASQSTRAAPVCPINPMNPTHPIGIFDSGVGGLSVLRHVRNLLPNEDLLYVGDQGNLPYGSRAEAFVEQRSLTICRFLIEQGVKAILIACNTATAAAVAGLRAKFDLPIIGMEPGLKPGILASRCGVVAILATEGTLGSDKFRSLVDRHRGATEVVIQPCPGWIEIVERGELSGPLARDAVAVVIEPLLAAGADTLVLGCTHYPYLEPVIRELVGDGIQIIDTGPAVARQLQQRLREDLLLSTDDQLGTELFWSTGAIAEVGVQVHRLWDRPCSVQFLP